MSWEHLRGPRLQGTCKCGGTDVAVKTPIVESSGVMVATADGGHVTGVSMCTMVAGTDYYDYDILIPGSVWRVTKATGALVRGQKVAMATAVNVDAGTSTNPAIGMVVDQDAASADTTVDIRILAEAATID